MAVPFLGCEWVLSHCRPLMKCTGKAKTGGHATFSWTLTSAFVCVPDASREQTSSQALTLCCWCCTGALCWSRYRNHLSSNQIVSVLWKTLIKSWTVNTGLKIDCQAALLEPRYKIQLFTEMTGIFCTALSVKGKHVSASKRCRHGLYFLWRLAWYCSQVLCFSVSSLFSPYIQYLWGKQDKLHVQF